MVYVDEKFRRVDPSKTSNSTETPLADAMNLAIGSARLQTALQDPPVPGTNMPQTPSENLALRDRLLGRLAVEELRAHEKKANPDYWRNVGDIELAAAHDVRDRISKVAEELPSEQYLDAVTVALEDLAASWRANDFDEDGYGVATVHAVGRELPAYGG